MEVTLVQVSRDFAQQVIFKDLNYIFKEGESYAILGGNGSGKSTLLSILYSALSPSSGHISWKIKGKKLAVSEVPFNCSLSGPYYELIEELTALQFLEFHKKFKPFISGVNELKLLDIAELSHAKHKEIRHFSSGMKQRFKLALSLLADVSLILLDEPTSNLDPTATVWYNKLLENYRGKRTIVVGSNFNEDEIGFCKHQLNINAYKHG